MADDASKEQSPAETGWKPSTGREYTAAEQTKHHRGGRLRRAVRKGGAVAGLGLAVTGIGLNLPDSPSTPQRAGTSITQTDNKATVNLSDVQLTGATLDAAPVAQTPTAPEVKTPPTHDVVVKNGDNIWDIGKKLLEDEGIKPTTQATAVKMHETLGENPDVKHPNDIHKGQTLHVTSPAVDKVLAELDKYDLTKVTKEEVTALPYEVKPVFEEALTVQADHSQATHYTKGTDVESITVRTADVKLVADEGKLVTDASALGIDSVAGAFKDAGIDLMKIKTDQLPTPVVDHKTKSEHKHIPAPVDEKKFSADVQKGMTAGFFIIDTLGTHHTVWDKVTATSRSTLGRPLTDAEANTVTHLIEGLNPEDYAFTKMQKDTKFNNLSTENIHLVAALSHLTPAGLKALDGKIPPAVYATVDSILKLNERSKIEPSNLVWNTDHYTAAEVAGLLAQLDPAALAQFKDDIATILKNPKTATADIQALLANPKFTAAFASVSIPPQPPGPQGGVPGAGSPDSGQPRTAGPATPAPTETGTASPTSPPSTDGRTASPTASGTEQKWTVVTPTETGSSTSTTAEASSTSPTASVSSEAVPTGIPGATETGPTGSPTKESTAPGVQPDGETQYHHRGMPWWKATGLALTIPAGIAVLMGLGAGANRLRKRTRLGRAISRNAKKAGDYLKTSPAVTTLKDKLKDIHPIQSINDTILRLAGGRGGRARAQQEAERAYLMERLAAEGRITPLVGPEVNRGPLIRALVDKRLQIGSDGGTPLRGIAIGLIRDTGAPVERIRPEQINLFEEVQARLTRLQRSYTPGRTNDLISPSTQTSVALLSLADRVFRSDPSVDQRIITAINSLTRDPASVAVGVRDRAVDTILAEVGITIEQTAPATRPTTIPGGTPNPAPTAPEAGAVDSVLRETLIGRGMREGPATHIAEGVQTGLAAVTADRFDLATVQDRVQTQFPDGTVPPEFMRLIQEVEYRFNQVHLGAGGERLTLTPRADQLLLALVESIDRSVPPTGGSMELSLEQIMDGRLNAGSAQGREAIDNILAAINLQVN